MAITRIDTVIIGGGQAGLSVSYYLTQQRREHVVLEQADVPGNAWRNHRWDSFTLNTPNWQSELPGAKHRGVDPDGFMTRVEMVAYFDDYVRRFHLPVRYGTQVRRVERDPLRGKYYVTTSDGHEIVACNVVMATGLYQEPKITVLSLNFPAHIKQVHSDGYRNPQELLPGAVLVVGSGQSGAQIAEELYESVEKSTSPSVVLVARRAVIVAGTRTGGLRSSANTTRPSPSCRRRRPSFPASRIYQAPAVAIPSICISSPAMASCCSVISAACTKAKSNWRPISMRIWQRPTNLKPTSSNRSTPTLPEKEWRCPRRRFQSCATASTNHW